jgi:hypothetical protein
LPRRGLRDPGGQNLGGGGFVGSCTVPQLSVAIGSKSMEGSIRFEN